MIHISQNGGPVPVMGCTQVWVPGLTTFYSDAERRLMAVATTKVRARQLTRLLLRTCTAGHGMQLPTAASCRLVSRHKLMAERVWGRCCAVCLFFFFFFFGGKNKYRT